MIIDHATLNINTSLVVALVIKTLAAVICMMKRLEKQLTTND